MTWMREEKERFDPFFGLKGDNGSEILIIAGEPDEVESNFENRDVEYRFPAYRGTLVQDEGRIEWEKILLTENGDNFLAALTTVRRIVGHWPIAVRATWKMRKSAKGRQYKSFTLERFSPPNWPDGLIDGPAETH